MMSEQEVLTVLAKCQAVLTDDHFVYTSGKHGSAYVNKDAVYPHTHEIAQLCQALAKHFVRRGIEVVVGPEKGAIILANRVAEILDTFTVEHIPVEVLGIYAEKEGEEFVLRRGYDRLVAGKKTLIVEDILTTGGSVKKVVDAVRKLNGEVVGVAAICNRGGVTAEDIGGVPELFALCNVKLDSWEETECPLCSQGVPINTDVGKGREFLERNQDRIRVCPVCHGLADILDGDKDGYVCRRCHSRVRTCPICGGLADIDDRDEDGYVCRSCPGYQRE